MTKNGDEIFTHTITYTHTCVCVYVVFMVVTEMYRHACMQGILYRRMHWSDHRCQINNNYYDE